MSDFIACFSSKFIRDGQTLTPNAKLLYILLITYADTRNLNEPVTLGIARMATETGLSMTTVKHALKELQVKNFIFRERKFNEASHTYLLKKV